MKQFLVAGTFTLALGFGLAWLPFTGAVQAQSASHACNHHKLDIGRATSQPARDAAVAAYRKCLAANKGKK